MKKLSMLVAATTVLSFAYAQKIQPADVPAAVKSALSKQYPNVSAVKWEKEGTDFEAEFKQKETEYSVVLDAAGSILETEVEIKPDALPMQALAYLQAHYAGQKVQEAEKITDAKGAVTYEAELKGKEVMFDSKGNFIKEKTKKND